MGKEEGQKVTFESWIHRWSSAGIDLQKKKKYSDAGAWSRRSPSQTAGCWAASPPSAHTTQAKGHGKSNGDHAVGTKGWSTKQPHVSMATREDQGQPSPFSIKDTFLAAFPRSMPKTSLFRSLRRYPWTGWRFVKAGGQKCCFLCISYLLGLLWWFYCQKFFYFTCYGQL